MLDWISQNKDLAEALSYWAAFFGIIAAVFAGVWGLWKHVQDRQEHRWMQARALYAEVIDDSIANPELNGSFWRTVDKDDVTAMTKYEFYIAKLLMAFEEIIYTKQYDEYWRDAMKIYIEDHVDYFVSKQFTREFSAYYPPLKQIIDEVISESKDSEDA